jgi:exosortase
MGMSKDRPTRDTAWWWRYGPIIPLAAVLASLPYTLVYLRNLWELPHYQFFPLLLIAVVLLARQRWGGRFEPGRIEAWLRFLLLCGGIWGSLCATLFASPWMGYFGFAFSLAGWLGYHRDREAGHSLMYLAMPVLLIWQPPYDTIQTFDTILIQNLQSLSSRLSSQSLDILGYAHHQPGTVLQFAGRSFGVAEACSGIQSFFAVLCFGALLIVYFRRGVVHSLFLMAICPVWAILMNTVRITAIPIAYAMFGIDLSHGLLHDILGYVTMGLAMMLMISFDELLLKLAEALPGSQTFEDSQQVRAPSTSSLNGSSPWIATSPTLGVPAHRQPSWLVAIPGILALGLFFGIQAYDVSESWGQQRDVIDFFRNEPLIELDASDAPTRFAEWQQRKYDQINRAAENDDLGQRSDIWFYDAPFGTLTMSFDQMFPGWHELTRCYRNSGWKPVKRTVIAGETAEGWPLVTVELQRNNEFGFLVFAEIGRSGRVAQPPDDFTYWTILEERLRGRLTPAVRGALFGVVTYQMQAFATTYEPLSEQDQQRMIENFKVFRTQMWSTASQRL